MAPNFSPRWTVTGGWCVVGLVSLSCTGRGGGDHIDYRSCFFQIHLHHPTPPTSPAIFSITFHGSGGMMEMAAAERMQPISDEITSKIWPLVLEDGDGANGRKGPASLGGGGGGLLGNRRQRLLWMIKTTLVLRRSTAAD